MSGIVWAKLIAYLEEKEMSTPFTDSYDGNFLLDTMMGPNAMRIMEEMASRLPLSGDMRVLDLGCGKGLSSIFLAEKYGMTVFAADLWITPTENMARFSRLGLQDKIIPLSIDATKGLPFAHEYFDMIISIDAYHYFGADDAILSRILPYLKTGGHMAVAVPGLRKDFPEGRFPEELQPYWQPDMHFYSCEWWRALWRKEPGIAVAECREMDCFRQAWDDWLQCPNPYARNDIAIMEAEGGKYFNLVQITGRKV